MLLVVLVTCHQAAPNRLTPTVYCVRTQHNDDAACVHWVLVSDALHTQYCYADR
jgi:hypothetical protein